jgi:hypothetical protein
MDELTTILATNLCSPLLADDLVDELLHMTSALYPDAYRVLGEKVALSRVRGTPPPKDMCVALPRFQKFRTDHLFSFHCPPRACFYFLSGPPARSCGSLMDDLVTTQQHGREVLGPFICAVRYYLFTWLFLLLYRLSTRQNLLLISCFLPEEYRRSHKDVLSPFLAGGVDVVDLRDALQLLRAFCHTTEPSRRYGVRPLDSSTSVPLVSSTRIQRPLKPL